MQYPLQKIVNISNLIGTSWKHRHSMPFSAVLPAVKGDTGAAFSQMMGCYRVISRLTDINAVLRGSKLHFDIKSP